MFNKASSSSCCDTYTSCSGYLAIIVAACQVAFITFSSHLICTGNLVIVGPGLVVCCASLPSPCLRSACTSGQTWLLAGWCTCLQCKGQEWALRPTQPEDASQPSQHEQHSLVPSPVSSWCGGLMRWASPLLLGHGTTGQGACEWQRQMHVLHSISACTVPHVPMLSKAAPHRSASQANSGPTHLLTPPRPVRHWKACCAQVKHIA